MAQACLYHLVIHWKSEKREKFKNTSKFEKMENGGTIY